MSNQRTITAIDSKNNVTYIHVMAHGENSDVYEDEDGNETQFLIEQIEDEDNIIEEEHEEIDETTIGETYEILESVDQYNVDQKRNVSVKTTVTKKLVEKKAKKEGTRIGRKRTHPEQTREIRKILSNTNKKYISSRGKEVQPKQFDESFECQCTKKCTQANKLPLKTRRQIFNMFWNMGTYEGRCAFISSCINEMPKKRCYTEKKEESRRKNTRKYFLKGVEVCKTTFCKTLQISNTRIDVCLQKTSSESFADERGRHRVGHGFSEEKKTKVVEYIKANYNQEESLRKLWQKYLSENNSEEDAISESYFKRLFYIHFDLKVKRVPQSKDQDEDDSDDDS